MIHPLLTKGRVLFVEKDCPHCAIYKKFIFEFNLQLKLDKRIAVVDCTEYDTFGICRNPIIKVFEPYFDAYPTLFIDGEKKEGVNSIIECKAFLNARLRKDFIFEKLPEYLPSINQYTIFNQVCRYRKGRIECH